MTAPAIVQCPDWCDVDDHESWDSAGGICHHLSYATELSALPYEVNGELFHESTNVILQQAEGSGPVIGIEVPQADGVPFREVLMTLAEAGRLRDNLSALIAEGLGR